MIYHVKGKFRIDKAHEFLLKLTDGTIEQQKPDGPEIVRAMKSATIDEHEMVNWTEECFCPTPLAHERETVYDFYFTNLTTKVTLKHKMMEGVSFIDMLLTCSESQRNKHYHP